LSSGRRRQLSQDRKDK